jgi:hypothetical protein
MGHSTRSTPSDEPLRNPFRIVPPAQDAPGWRVDGADGVQVWPFATEPAARAFAVAAFAAWLSGPEPEPARD